MGWVQYDEYLKVLQVSSAHVYLTYPFVLSWSMLEAMAAECLVIASSTAPVLEVIKDRENGLLVDFFSAEEIAVRVEEALDQPDRMAGIRRQARATVVARYDLKQIALPAQLKLIDSLIAKVPFAGGVGGPTTPDAALRHPKSTSTRSGKRPARRKGLASQVQLTAKEAEVLRWLRKGKSTVEIARLLDRSEYTIKNQMRGLYEKLGANNRGQALHEASRLALPD